MTNKRLVGDDERRQSNGELRNARRGSEHIDAVGYFPSCACGPRQRTRRANLISNERLIQHLARDQVPIAVVPHP